MSNLLKELEVIEGLQSYLITIYDESAHTKIGDLRELTTDDKANIVNAINEAIRDISANYNLMISKIGDLTTLSTSDKTNLVNAINEAMSYIASNYNQFSGEIGDLDNLSTQDKTNLVNAINSLKTALQSAIDSTNAYVINTVKALASNGIILNTYNTIRVNPNGTGDFTTLPNAISTAESSAVPTIILMEQGTYNMPNLFPPSVYSDGMMVPNNTYLVGNGERLNVLIAGAFNNVNNEWSPVNLTKNCGLFNLTVQGYKTRYCVHDDFSEDGEYTRIIDNVRLYGNSLGLRWAYGAGTRNGNKTILKHVEFKNDNGCFSIHNNVGEKKPTYIVLEDCDFEQYTIGDNPFDIILTAMGSRDNITTHGDVIVDVHNCNANVIQFGAQSGYSNYFYLNCDNENTGLFFGYDPYKINCKGIVKCTNNTNLTMGKLVTFTDYGKKCQAFEAGYTKPFANGVTISGTSIDGFNEIVVRTNGLIQGSDIGISVEPSKWLNYDSTTNALVVENTEGAVPVAVGLSTGFWKLVL